ncbi:MAG: hypothetical protein ACI4TC_01550 [Kiritimatiellia bacterium]
MSKHTLFPVGTALLISAAQLPSLATTTSTYDIQSPGLLAQTDNLLRQEGTQKSFTSTATTGFYETNAASTDCLFDGAIPYASSAYAEQESRYLIRKGDMFVWTFNGTKTLDDVRFWTQWSDGYRTDISVASVAVTYDGETWETLPDSSFSASKTESENTVAPYLGSEKANLHYRRVRFGNEGEEPTPLAVGILGLKVVFGTQELEYTSHWELEAKGSDYYPGETPIVRVTGKRGTLAPGGESASETLTVSLPFTGSESPRVSVGVRWGVSPEALTEELTLSGTYGVGETVSVVIPDLEPRGAYYAQVFATAGEETGVSEIIGFKASAEPITLIQSAYTTKVYQFLPGTQLGLGVNLPGGSWVCGGGWEWAKPKLEGDWLNSVEEKVGFALSLDSNGDYVKPERITVSAEIAHSQGSGGVGFWSSMVPLSGNYPKEGGAEGETEIIRYDARVGYTGLVFNPSAKTLQVYSDGKLQGSPATVEVLGVKDYHTLTYTIDTSTGDIEWVMFNGAPVHGLTSRAFTDANTHLVGLISMQGGRTGCKVFEVSEGKDLPADPVLVLEKHTLPVIVGTSVEIAVTAMNSLTEEPIPATLIPGDCDGAVLQDGKFRWTATVPGTYHAAVSASTSSKTVNETIEIRVYPEPAAAPAGMKPVYIAESEKAPSKIQFAGTVQAEATDRTDWGLQVNRPGATWIWNSGYDWAIPFVGSGSTSFDLNNELATVMLPLADAGSYTKPEQIFVEAAFRFTGRGVVGFWKGLPTLAASTDVMTGFTGFYFEFLSQSIRFYVDGKAVGDARRVEFFEGQQQTLRFVLDRKHKVIRDLVVNDFPVGGEFEIANLTDELSDYVGIGAHGNHNGTSGRLQFQSLRVSGSVKGGLIVVVR